MANCTVTLSGNTAARSGAVGFRALPNQIVDGTAIDTSIIIAQASGTDYIAVLIQGARYELISDRFPFLDPCFLVPAASTADLVNLLSGSARMG